MEAASSVLPGRLEDTNKTGTATKKKPVRRDPEKRRLQNISAQKKYRESLLLFTVSVLYHRISYRNAVRLPSGLTGSSLIRRG